MALLEEVMCLEDMIDLSSLVHGPSCGVIASCSNVILMKIK